MSIQQRPIGGHALFYNPNKGRPHFCSRSGRLVASRVLDQRKVHGELGPSPVDNVFRRSVPPPEGTLDVQGYDFDKGRDLDKLMASMMQSGFQATQLGRAVELVNEMGPKGIAQLRSGSAGTVPQQITWRMSDDPVPKDCPPEIADPKWRKQARCKIFLGFTSNMMSAGTREILRYLCKNRMVDVLVTTAGGVEEDIVKCMGKTYLGEFHLRGRELRAKGQNRVGNMLIPNNNYCAFEAWMQPVLDRMLEEQKAGTSWTPSKMIKRLGQEINDESSVYYWCAKSNIPVYCPAITDGSIGDMLYFHATRRPGLKCDIVEDVVAMDHEAIKCKTKTGVILLGGGLPKHHIFNANMMRGGLDYCAMLNTAQEFDGSDSGAQPDEAVSWGKIGVDGKAVKVCIDASVGFPLLVSQTFAKHWQPKAKL